MMKPDLWCEVEGTPIYRVHKYGYGCGPVLADWFSTSDSDRTVFDSTHRTTEHTACAFALDALLRAGLGQFPGPEAYYEAGRAAIAEALKQGQLRLPIK
jgi:hypothetical protein